MNANFSLRGDHQQKPGEGNGRKQMRDKDKRVTDYTNANIFISNNANPFLVSPYSPNNTLNSVTTDIKQQLSTFIADLSTIVNPIDYSIKVSTIYPKPSDNLVTISSNTNIYGDTIVFGLLTVTKQVIINTGFSATSGIVYGPLSVQTLMASSINTNNISTNNGFINNGVVSSLTFSSLNATVISGPPVTYTNSLKIVLGGTTYVIPISTFQ